MPVTATAGTTTSALFEVPRKKWTREEIRVLDTTGIFDGQNYELVDGELVNKMAKFWSHVQGTDNVHSNLLGIFGRGLVYQEAPSDVAAADCPINEPQPDVVVLKRLHDNLRLNPQPQDVRLLVEVADSSLRVDTTTKGELYARAGIDDYWVLDLNGRCLRVFRQPVADSYQEVLVHGEHESASPLSRPDVLIRVADLLP